MRAIAHDTTSQRVKPRNLRTRYRGSELLILFSAALLCASHAAASTITFDDIDATAGDVILTSYQGYNWTNFSVYTSTPGFPGFNNGIVSAPNGAYTSGDALGSPIVSAITASNAFNFIGAYLGSGWYDGLSVTLNGLYNGAEEFSQTVTVDTEGAQLFTFNFDGINELDIYSTITSSTIDPYGCGPSGCSQVTLDDVTITPGVPPPPTTTPEPMSFLLAGVGFCALVMFRRPRFFHRVSR